MTSELRLAAMGSGNLLDPVGGHSQSPQLVKGNWSHNPIKISFEDHTGTATETQWS